ncbi:hypothetical protein Ahy_A06g028436 isoform M [Arachis hypogaea]|uniref:Uncharacterized protein n=1 Tax=Arachis hypogaea TaxID=3818 RepID=A0A445CR01_ARAHY|nr:hypothetical protein Ahy_A06g028436 isoform M [Arachis hypogaea]
MVSTRAAMESRLEAVEKWIEELQEAQQRSLEAFSAKMLRQMRELLPEQHQGGGAGANDTGGENDGGRNEQDDERIEGNVGARFGFFKNSSSAKYNTHDGSSESRGEIGSNTNRGTPTPRTGLTTSLNGGNNASHLQTTHNSGTRRLSNEDWAERQRKGLFFRCGEKWGPDHRCSMKHYQIILLGEDAEEEAEGDELDQESEIPSLKEQGSRSFKASNRAV